MQLSGLDLNHSIISNELTELKVGQLLQVEVLSKGNSNEGIISLAGKQVKAKFETPAKAGERFWVCVKDINKNELVLTREYIISKQIKHITAAQLELLLNRGCGFDPYVANLLENFLKPDNRVLSLFLKDFFASPTLRSIFQNIFKVIPSWENIDGYNYKDLIEYFKLLGLNYENKLLERIKNGQEKLNSSFKGNIKAQIMNLLKDSKNKFTKAERNNLESFLEEITGQQLWIQTGTKKNAYSIMNIPLQDNGLIYQANIAVESLRKGRKIDIRRCHIAVQVDTSNLGKIGADIWLYDNTLNICVLHDNPDSILQLINKVSASTYERFTQMGIYLKSITVKRFSENPQFFQFIKGKQSEVDLIG